MLRFSLSDFSALMKSLVPSPEPPTPVTQAWGFLVKGTQRKYTDPGEGSSHSGGHWAMIGGAWGKPHKAKLAPGMKVHYKHPGTERKKTAEVHQIHKNKQGEVMGVTVVKRHSTTGSEIARHRLDPAVIMGKADPTAEGQFAGREAVAKQRQAAQEREQTIRKELEEAKQQSKERIAAAVAAEEAKIQEFTSSHARKQARIKAKARLDQLRKTEQTRLKEMTQAARKFVEAGYAQIEERREQAQQQAEQARKKAEKQRAKATAKEAAQREAEKQAATEVARQAEAKRAANLEWAQVGTLARARRPDGKTETALIVQRKDVGGGEGEHGAATFVRVQFADGQVARVHVEQLEKTRAKKLSAQKVHPTLKVGFEVDYGKQASGTLVKITEKTATVRDARGDEHRVKREQVRPHLPKGAEAVLPGAPPEAAPPPPRADVRLRDEILEQEGGAAWDAYRQREDALIETLRPDVQRVAAQAAAPHIFLEQYGYTGSTPEGLGGKSTNLYGDVEAIALEAALYGAREGEMKRRQGKTPDISQKDFIQRRVWSEVKTFLRQNTGPLQVPERVTTALRNLRRAEERLLSQYGREATAQELANALGLKPTAKMTPEQRVEELQQVRLAMSQVVANESDEGVTEEPWETVADPAWERREEAAKQTELAYAVERALFRLKPKEREVVGVYKEYGDQLSVTELAGKAKVAREEWKPLLEATFAKLRAMPELKEIAQWFLKKSLGGMDTGTQRLLKALWPAKRAWGWVLRKAFDATAHPRARKGETGKYRAGRFVPLGQGRQANPEPLKRIGVTSDREGKSPERVRLQMEFFTKQLQKIPGVSHVSVKEGRGGWQGGGEITWVTTYRGDGEAKKLLARLGKATNQDAVLITEETMKDDPEAQPRGEITFTHRLSKASIEGIEQALAKLKFGGWTWVTAGRKTRLVLIHVPPWAEWDAETHRNKVQEAGQILQQVGVSNQVTFRPMKVEVMEDYDAILRRREKVAA